jgi:hypothetical protein
MTTIETDGALYALAVEQHARAYAHRNIQDYRAMLDEAFKGYTRSEVGGFRRRMQVVDRAAAVKNGLPRFPEWQAARVAA